MNRQSDSFETARPLGPGAAAAALMIAALWGGTPVAIAYSVDTLPPVAVAGIRFAMAALFMLFWCRVEGSPLRLQAAQVVPATITGVLLFFQISLFNAGVQHSNSSHGTVLINTFIFWVVLSDHFLMHSDRLSWRKTVGLILAATGVLLVVGLETPMASGASAARDRPTLYGDMLLMASGFVLGVRIIYAKRALRIIEPGTLILWHDVVGVALFALWSWMFEEVSWSGFQLPAVLGLIYQGFFVAGLCFAVQAVLLRRYSASKVSVFNFATPLFGVVLAVLFRGDELSPWILVSGGCVAGGILLVNLRPKAETRKSV